jgi:O-antigen/teichoic acid export membrane protein
MESELKNRLDALEKKTDAIYVSVEKTRKYFLWTFIGSIIALVIPLLGIGLILPWFVSMLTSTYGIM